MVVLRYGYDTVIARSGSRRYWYKQEEVMMIDDLVEDPI